MTRILWHSAAPWCGTGYGQQTALFAPRIAASGHDVALSAHFGLRGAQLAWDGLAVYPGDDKYGNITLPRWIDLLEPELVITLLDPWVLQGDRFRDVLMASWTPVDHEPLSEKHREFFAKSGARPISMSRHGHQVLVDAGFDPVYVPHGVDTEIFQPYDRRESREMFDLPQDAFLVGFVGTNMGKDPSRKAIPELLRAFHAFRQRHDDALLYLHTDFAGIHDGVNIGWFCDRIGLSPAEVRGTGATFYELGIRQDVMARLYSAFDVLLSPSYGEGFGIAPVESQACGTPVIASDFSAQRELCGAGWLVDGDPYWIDTYRSWWQQPRVESIVDALEHAYMDAASMRENARSFAVQYDAGAVFVEHWLPALAKLGASTVEMATA